MNYISGDSLLCIAQFFPFQPLSWVCSSPRCRRAAEQSDQGIFLGSNQFQIVEAPAERGVRRYRLQCHVRDTVEISLTKWWLQRCTDDIPRGEQWKVSDFSSTHMDTSNALPFSALLYYRSRYRLLLVYWGSQHSTATKDEGMGDIASKRARCSLGELFSLGQVERLELIHGALAATPQELRSYLARPRGLSELCVKNTSVPFGDLLTLLYANGATLNFIEAVGIALPRLQLLALCPHVKELVLRGVSIHPQALVIIPADHKANSSTPVTPTPVLDEVPISDLVVLKRLQRLDLSNSKKPLNLNGASCCASLRILNLSGCHITDSDICHLSRLPCIEDLLMARTRVTNVHPLCSCMSIKFLQLSNTLVDSQGICGLELLPNIIRLDLSFTLVSDINCLGKSKSLLYLNVSKTAVTTDGIRGLGNLAALEQLILNDNAIRDVSFLSGAVSLKILLLQSTLVDSDGITGLGRLQVLQDLCLAHTRVDKVMELKSCRSLRRLDLQGSLATTAGVAEIWRLPQLQILLLSHTDVSSLRMVLQSRSLRQLEVKQSHVTDGTAFEGITAESTLTDVTVTHSVLTSVNPLGQCRSLRSLNMWSSKITSAGITGLRLATALQTVDLAESAVSDITPLLSCSNLQSLILYKSPLVCVEGLGKLPFLKRLDIADTLVRSVSCLGCSKRLEVLNISSTDVDDAGFEGIERIRSIRVVLLSFTKVSQLGILGQCPRLEELYAQSCPVTAEGLVGLESAKQLIKVNLSYTNINGGISRFGGCTKLLKFNVKLTNVPLSEIDYLSNCLPHCRITNDAAQRLAKDVMINSEK